MGDYKQLNKDLIDANRELKQAIAAYQRELNLMRAEVIEHHRLRIESERDCRDRMLSFGTKILKNVLSSLREIDTNINVMELLDYDNCVQNGSCNVGVSCQSDSRRSIHLAKEFRRSSALCRQHSVLQISPTRRHNADNAINDETEMEAVSEQSGSDMDLENSMSEENVIDVENDQTGENEELRCIRETNEEESEDEIAMHRSGDGPTFMRQPIKNLTNLDMEDRQPKVNIVTKRGKQHHRRSDIENSFEVARNIGQDSTYTPSSYVNEIEMEDNLVASMHRSLHLSHSTCNMRELHEQCDAGKDSPSRNIEEFNRALMVRVQRLREPSHIGDHFENEEHTITTKSLLCEQLLETGKNGELSLGLTEFSMGNFMDASCSTPCHSIVAAAVATAKTEETNNSSSVIPLSQTTSQSTRPSRRCAPKALAEPSLRDKLRSDSGKRRATSKKR
ncbi:uncharacterized protein LOC129245967 [Anastrepha obliqua]|uniref:uncharacterized protein LOC129245967 n=1 Tax=Anastrepha obliqua TaxID=95512 RepID=UPI00240A29B4|nr:uncharacterized protein LOC129245967 [Anastrepha obliqua]